MGVQSAVVVGGGNIWRGRQAPRHGPRRADYMGMLATVMNALALQDALEKSACTTRVQTAIQMAQIAEPYIPLRAIRHLEKGRVVIFAAGLGVPFFSTDTTAAQRALEINAEAILKGTKVDGVYDADPNVDPTAKRSTSSSTCESLARAISVMDATAISLCMENKLPILVFNLPRGRQHPPGRPGRADRDPRPRRSGRDDRDQPCGGRRAQDAAGARPSEGRSGRIRTGRAAPALLNRVTVEYYGTPVPLNQLAWCAVPEPRLLMIAAVRQGAIGAIEKAIMTSDLGITPSTTAT